LLNVLYVKEKGFDKLSPITWIDFVVSQKVSSSTQNHAFNALPFFLRHVLHKEFGRIESRASPER